MHDDVLNRVKAALVGREGVDIGHFQWINLDMIKTEVGEKWPEIRKKIYKVSTQYIEKRLDDRDALVQCRGGFILVYGKQRGQDAAQRTADISDGLNRFFLGDRVLKHLQISSQSRELDISEFADLIKRTQNTDTTAEALSAAAAGNPASTNRAKESDNMGWQPLESSGRSVVIPRAAANAGTDTPAKPNQATTGQATRGPATTGPANATSHPEIDATEELNSLDSLPFKVPKAEWDDIIFKPCWDAKFEYITANFCLPRRVHKGVTLYGRATLLGNTDRQILQSLDHAVAVTAQRGFLRQLADKHKCAVVIPVRYDTVIGTQDRIRYFSILQKVPQKARKYFYIRVDGIPDGAPVWQMEELFRSMRIFGSNLLAKIPPGTVRLSRFDNCSIAIYSTSLQSEWARTGLPSGVTQKLIDQAISIQRQGKRGALTQVDTLEQLCFGLDAGYEIFTGSAIGRDQPLPTPLTAISRQDLNLGRAQTGRQAFS